eukprot:CAMPEP_0118981728 /NCGR_PEP_ID=MMETSP1173-20130426/31188_1 /TAXON_ID=1034831 /ORGANISM="Rhizochromulina marina cf, Strain CCMP1243" /LENGTH=289 /DNA_ID=CAMNT_0006932171 /DNA_START=44 /DNA_END=913 /DNA_ORIENTATION=+
MSKGKTSNPQVAMVSGAVAGGIEAFAMWPTENIKTQLQLQTKAESPKFTSFAGGVRYVVKNEGVLGLYTGLVPIIIGSLPKAGIRFGGNAFFKGHLLQMDLPVPTTIVNLLGGVCAGACEAVLAVTPMETVKTKTIQMKCGFLEGMGRILSDSGVGGLYKGVVPTVIKQASNQGLRFMFMGTYKDWRSDGGKRKLTTPETLLGGMGAGCFSTLGNNPFDVVKTKMQGVDASRFKGTLDCFVQIFRTEGIGGYYRGVLPRLYRVVPGQGIIFASFDLIEPVVAGAMGISI